MIRLQERLASGIRGGPKVDKLAKEGNPKAIAFPKAHVDGAPMDFSFSGIKSAVLNYINGCKMKGEEINRADIAASFLEIRSLKLLWKRRLKRHACFIWIQYALPEV